MRLKQIIYNEIIVKSVLASVFLGYVFFIASPIGFPTYDIVTIPEGATLSEVAHILKEEKIIRSQFLFKAFIVIAPGDSGVLWGKYYFPNRDNLFMVSYRLSRGNFGITPVKVRILEGEHNKIIAQKFLKAIPEFDEEKFLKIAESLEGYLFPDTYYFMPTQTEEEIIDALHNTFNEKTKDLKSAAEKAGKDWQDIIIMASMIEKEASTFDTRKKIAGILWKRIEIGMPLQVDAVFVYILDKKGTDITLDDLLVDSPYNTYKYAGLPIGPISNPGLDSIEASIYYEETPYLYYLSDREGVTHYAEDFETHKSNKSKYLYKL
jgi:UPF0755 protein